MLPTLAASTIQDTTLVQQIHAFADIAEAELFLELILTGDLPKDRADHVLRGLGMQCPQREIEVIPSGGVLDGGGEETLTADGLLRPDDDRRSTARIAGVRCHASQRTREAKKKVRAYTLFPANNREILRNGPFQRDGDNDLTARATRRS